MLYLSFILGILGTILSVPTVIAIIFIDILAGTFDLYLFPLMLIPIAALVASIRLEKNPTISSLLCLLCGLSIIFFGKTVWNFGLFSGSLLLASSFLSCFYLLFVQQTNIKLPNLVKWFKINWIK